MCRERLVRLELCKPASELGIEIAPHRIVCAHERHIPVGRGKGQVIPRSRLDSASQIDCRRLSSGTSCISAATGEISCFVALRMRFTRKANSTSTRNAGILSSASPQVISTESVPSHYSERQSLGASPSFGVFDNALPADSLTLYMAPGRGCWPTAPGQPSAPASREGPGGVAARGWWSVRERLIGMCRTACRDGRVMWMSPLRHGGQPA